MPDLATLTMASKTTRSDVKEEPTVVPLSETGCDADSLLSGRDVSWQSIRILVALIASVPISGAVVVASIAAFSALGVIICTAAITALGLVGGLAFCLCAASIGFGIIVSAVLWLLVILLLVTISLTPVAAIAASLLSLDPSSHAAIKNRQNGIAEQGVEWAEGARAQHASQSSIATFAAFRRNARDMWTSYVRGY